MVYILFFILLPFFVIYCFSFQYDTRFADAFWNSSKQSLSQHLLMILSSWAIVCDVWYLPPVKQEPNESGLQFANRVKAVIAQQGGLVDLEWWAIGPLHFIGIIGK